MTEAELNRNLSSINRFVADQSARGVGAKTQGEEAQADQAVAPEAVTGEKDAVDAEGRPEYQGVDAAKLVPYLVAAVQELSAKVAALEAK